MKSYTTGTTPCPPKAVQRRLANATSNLFFSKFNVKLMARMLIRPLTISLVEAALDTLNKTSFLGVDGIPCSVYSKFRGAFAPRMLQITESTLATGSLNPDWAVALLNLIPKGRGTVHVAHYRPLVLQNTSHKWTAAIISLQTQDLVATIPPSEKKVLGMIHIRPPVALLWRVAYRLGGHFLPRRF